MKPRNLLFLALIIAIMVRLIPVIIYSTPFSTDSWPLICLSEKLIRSPTNHIFNDTYYDGYNNHWPGVILFSSTASIVTEIKPIILMPLLVPTVNVLSMIFIVLLVSRYNGSREAIFSALALAVIPPLIVFTSAATKEGFAHPLFVMLIYLALKPVWRKAEVLVSLLASLTLVLSHHLTTFMYIYIILTTLLVASLSSVKTNIKLKTSVYPLLFVFVFAIIHHLVIGPGVFRIAATPRDILTLFLYTILFTMPIVLFGKAPNNGQSSTRFTIPYKPLFIVVIVFAVVVYASTYSPAPGIPSLGQSVLYYSIPYIIVPIAFWYTYRQCFIEKSKLIVFLIAWTMGCFSIIAYLLFADNPLGASAIHRVIDFMDFPLAISIGFVSSRLFNTASTLFQRILGVVLVFLAVLSGISVMSLIVSRNDTVSFYWLYNKAEFYAGLYVKEYVGNMSITGDAKIDYLFKYFEINVYPTPLIRLVVDGVAEDNTLYILYRENYSKGIVQALMIFSLSKQCIEILEKDTNRVYDSSMVNMYIG
ncbi:hypothetical protein J4526_05640 [Desulfurococcaceae archaeon MEX13E-LK6-19]|nr:hypothetical protein J4526_05640 [Desulfurococcaceae archaeon MEX13E-LK6-19]